MKTSILLRLLLPMIILLVCLGIYLNLDSAKKNDSTKQCAINDTEKCSLDVDQHQVSVQFLQHIELEEALFLEIVIPSHWDIDKVWAQGVNMFMGKNAVVINSQQESNGKTHYNATLFLGACSEPNMKWQIILKTIGPGITKKSWFFNFETSRH